MKILVVGKGGREHAICWRLALSGDRHEIYAAPGNAGISKIANCVGIAVDDIRRLVDFALEKRIDLTVVGPELPLTLGIVDEFESHGLRIFGPSRKAALIEASKAFAKEFMQKYHIPTASFRIFTEHFEALDFVKRVGCPVVVKADGLAAGKGAVVCQTVDEACDAVEKIMVQQVFGSAGLKLVVEEYLVGQEVTVMAFTDGKNIVPMLTSQDHKRVGDGDTGPNTGGMGAYAPTPMVDSAMMTTIYDEVLEPTICGLAKEGRTFKGVLYVGMMITDRGPKVLEYNCRFGDPETQAVLPLLESDLLEIFLSISEGYLDVDEIRWSEKHAACVVISSGGYPGNYEKGKVISGLDRISPAEGIVFHSGTAFDGEKVVTAGGRVLSITGLGNNLREAVKAAYRCVDKISFENMHYRKDIGFRALSRTGAVA